MRATVTIDPDVEARLRAVMQERGVTFKEALNGALRAGLGAPAPRRTPPHRQETFKMGFRPEVLLDKAIVLAAGLEDEEIARKLSLRKWSCSTRASSSTP